MATRTKKSSPEERLARSESEMLVTDAVALFLPEPEVPGLYKPKKRLSVNRVFRGAQFADADNFPEPLPDIELVSLGWCGLCGMSGGGWEVHAVMLSSGERIYWEQVEDGAFLLAASREPAMDEAFLRRLFSTNGKAYGTAIIDGAPSNISTHRSIKRRLLVELLVACFDAANAWESVLEDDEEEPVDPVREAAEAAIAEQVAKEVRARRGEPRNGAEARELYFEVHRLNAERTAAYLATDATHQEWHSPNAQVERYLHRVRA